MWPVPILPTSILHLKKYIYFSASFFSFIWQGSIETRRMREGETYCMTKVALPDSNCRWHSSHTDGALEGTRHAISFQLTFISVELTNDPEWHTQTNLIYSTFIQLDMCWSSSVSLVRCAAAAHPMGIKPTTSKAGSQTNILHFYLQKFAIVWHEQNDTRSDMDRNLN